MNRILINCLLTLTLVSGYLQLQAAPDEKPPGQEASSVKVAKQMPFYGTVKAVDLNARTLTLAGKDKDRVFLVEDSSKIHDSGEVKKLEDVKVGRRVGGLAKAKGEGQWVIATLNLGVKQSRTVPDEEKAAGSSE